MITAFLFTALIPLAVLTVLGVVLAGGRMNPAIRARIETVLLFVVYPLLILWWLWQVLANLGGGDMTFALLFGVASVGALHEGLKLFRRRVLQARAGKAAE